MSEADDVYELEENCGWERMLVDRNLPAMIEKMNWKPFESILDYGCGTGSVTSEFLFPIAEKYSSVLTAVDISEERIDLAHSRHLHVLCNYVAGDIMTEDTFKWPLHNVKFDKIICLHVVHMISNYEELLRRLERCMNKGGQLAVGIHYSSIQKINHSLCEHPKWRKYMAPMKKFRAPWTWDVSLDFPGSVKSIIESLGLKTIDFLAYDAKYAFGNVNCFAESLMAANLGTKNVPTELRSDLKTDIAQLASETFDIPINSKPFKIPLQYVRFVVEK